EVEGALGFFVGGVGVRCGGGSDGDGAVECADDAVGDGVGEAEGCADGDGDVADVEVGGVAPFDGRVAGAVDFDDGEVGEGVGADDLGGEEASVPGLHVDVDVGGGPVKGDDVGVGDDVAVVADEHAGAAAGRASALDVDGD